ncbi:MAG: RimK/LysX family protein [Flavobacteriales bacterium]
MSKHQVPLQIIGRRERITLPDLGNVHVEAKIDTGAFRTAIHCESCREVQVDGLTQLEAVFNLDGNGNRTFHFANYTQREVKNSFGQSEVRYSVKIKIKIGGRDIRSDVTLTDRSEMKYQVLIGRKTLLKKFLVDVNQVHLLGHH